MNDLNKMARAIGAFEDFADLERRCRNGYIPTIRTDMAYDELPTRRAKDLVRRELVARGYRVFDGHTYAGPDPAPLARQLRERERRSESASPVSHLPRRAGAGPMSSETKSKVVIGSNNNAMVVHTKPVRYGKSQLMIVSAEPQHDRYSEMLEEEIMRRAATRGGDFVRFSDVTAAMTTINERTPGPPDYPCGPRGVLAKIQPTPKDAPRPERLKWREQNLETPFEHASLRITHQTTRPEQTRYAARTAAYLWQDLQKLPEGQRRALANNLRNFAQLDTKQRNAVLDPLNDMAVVARDRVCKEAGLSSRSFWALALPPQSAYQQPEPKRSRGRGR